LGAWLRTNELNKYYVEKKKKKKKDAKKGVMKQIEEANLLGRKLREQLKEERKRAKKEEAKEEAKKRAKKRAKEAKARKEVEQEEKKAAMALAALKVTKSKGVLWSRECCKWKVQLGFNGKEMVPRVFWSWRPHEGCCGAQQPRPYDQRRR
jgi:hypothetical protein